MSSFFLTLFLFFSLYGEWSHIEFGAGNYGKDGYSQTSQKEVIKKIKVTDKPNYVDRLPEKGYGRYDPYEQYAVLFWTLDQLIKRNGENGIFHINDINSEYAEEAAAKLKAYAVKQGYKLVKIEVKAGDFHTLDLNRLYDTAHLKNPEISFFNERMDGDRIYSTIESRKKGRDTLIKLASFSKTGLTMFTLYDNIFFPDAEKREFAEKGLFYNETADWPPVPYVFPRGEVIKNEKSKVFHIKNGIDN